MDRYGVIVVGAGHAGIEGALACAHMGCRTLMLTLNAETIGAMSCNPAIGGVGKGQLVKEIDALGGEMAKAADACGIQFRILNASKGQAVQSSRAQVDMYKYNQYMTEMVKRQDNLELKEAEAKKLIVNSHKVQGIVTDKGEEIFASSVIICPGTFLDGLIHRGLKHFSGGRINEKASTGLVEDLKKIGFNILRFKTGTCPRLDKKTIDFSRLIVQKGDIAPKPFSFSTKELHQKQVPCYITYTNKNTHKIIQDNLKYSPLYQGVIKSTGVRYCPSIEDKIVKFQDRERHQIFLEPQGLNTCEVYPNGLSTSLPEEAQVKMLRSIEGLEDVEVIRFGYAIEHAVVDSTQAYPTLETKLIKNLYFAGQINGTTGYEEAASQGLIAGINAALRIKNKEPLILDRSTSYIGVLIDDLTTKGTNEPYRMFTSRVEYRLILREDNADLRLTKVGHDIGLVSKKSYLDIQKKQAAIKTGIDFLSSTRIKPTKKINDKLRQWGQSPITKAVTLEDVLKRPKMNLAKLKELDPSFKIPPLKELGGSIPVDKRNRRVYPLGLDHIQFDIPEFAFRQIEIEIKYAGFIQRQVSEVVRFKNLEKIKIPYNLEYGEVPGLSREIKEKLISFRPLSLGQASRISGVTPAAISILMIWLKKISDKRGQNAK